MNIFVAKPKETPDVQSGAMLQCNWSWIFKIVFIGCLFLQVSLISVQIAAAQSIKVGESEIIPSVSLEYVSEDNTFRTAEDQVESTGIIVSPKVSWEANRRLLRLRAGYQGSYASYSESILDFNDHSLFFNVDANPQTRHRVSGSFAYDKEHESLGTGQTRFESDSDDQIESTLITLRTDYTFGASGARGNVGGGLVFTRETFDNLAFLTIGDDNSKIMPYAQFSYRVSPDTRLVAESRYRVVDFDDDLRDRDEISFLVGFNMKATARTGGAIRLGVTKADYDAAGRSDRNLFVANVNVTFRPRSFSSINLSFNRGLSAVDNDAANSQASIEDRLRLTWSHKWSGRFSTAVRYEKDRVERECPLNGTEKDTFGLEFAVRIRRWISIGADGRNSQRTVGDCSGALEPGAEDYDLNRVGVFLRATL